MRKKLLSVIREHGVRVWLADLRVKKLANSYLEGKVIPLEFSPEAEHIAAATILDVDVLVSWNLRHIVNLHTKSAVKEMNSKLGYNVPQIVRSDEVL